MLEQAEAVDHVARLLDVGDVHSEVVAHLGIDPVRIEPAADGDHLGYHLIAVAGYAGLRLIPHGVRVLVFGFRINFGRLNLGDLQDLREMRLRFGVSFGDHLHFRRR